MKEKRKTPYQVLQEIGRDYANAVTYPRTRLMWRYTDKDFLPDLNQRIQAANQLGYEVVLEVKDGQIHVYYQKKRPERPFEFRYRDWGNE
jgi:hypothetical protein